MPKNEQHGGETRPMGEANTWEVIPISAITNAAQKGDDDDLEVHWDGSHDSGDPRKFPLTQRWSMVIVTPLSSLCTSQKNSTAQHSLPILARPFLLWPLELARRFLAPLSEFYGRRPVYLAPMSLFILWLTPCATAQNIETMLLASVLSGFSKQCIHDSGRRVDWGSFRAQ
ncbi:hypothetical protein ACJ72_00959 [Emergomyces africanus]|uniref:Uncharacterized protein n=1 Tax=Emergomyces africanus TaxID=1955775 RepID=A0A1B7P6Y8_9EURO|nr:hypothetical protein ACJ72_00959 [Emergomyces africanus]